MPASAPCRAPQAYVLKSSCLSAPRRGPSLASIPSKIVLNHQIRCFRLGWSSPWDSDHIRERLRHHRAALKQFAQVRPQVPYPHMWPGEYFPQTRIVRQVIRFERWAQDIESSYTMEFRSTTVSQSSVQDGAQGSSMSGAPSPDNLNRPQNAQRGAEAEDSGTSRPSQSSSTINQSASAPAGFVHTATATAPTSGATPASSSKEAAAKPRETEGPAQQPPGDTVENGGEDSLPKSSNSKPLTGYYVRDFPEDFTGSWKEKYKSEELPANPDPTSTSSRRLEPALDRIGPEMTASASRNVDSAGRFDTEEPSKPPHILHQQGTQETNARDEMSAASPSAQKAPSTEPTVPLSEKQAARPSFSVPDAVDYPPAPSETNRYRILVHDPATGTISTADATSVAADHNEVLTPSQIMPRLANPAKFLPHFDVLQSQGYEAVSGSGDVLVFRKVREPTEPGTVFLRRTAAGSASASAHLAGSGTASQAPAINPIDMMGSESVTPAIGNFTSPTGYVSYDHDLSFGGGESGFVVKPPPPFRKYNSIAAASDADTEYDRKDKASDKSSPVLWRMTLGAGWIAGLVYAGSVVNEFFNTGGENGKGTKGVL